MEEEADIPIGSFVLLSGTLAEWESPSCPGQFDAPLYYQIQGISAKLLHACLESAEAPESGIPEFFRQLRDSLSKRLDACFSEETAGVLKTMLLGDKSELSGEIQELYREAGILHILAISGVLNHVFGYFDSV